MAPTHAPFDHGARRSPRCSCCSRSGSERAAGDSEGTAETTRTDHDDGAAGHDRRSRRPRRPRAAHDDGAETEAGRVRIVVRGGKVTGGIKRVTVEQGKKVTHRRQLGPRRPRAPARVRPDRPTSARARRPGSSSWRRSPDASRSSSRIAGFRSASSRFAREKGGARVERRLCRCSLVLPSPALAHGSAASRPPGARLALPRRRRHRARRLVRRARRALAGAEARSAGDGRPFPRGPPGGASSGAVLQRRRCSVLGVALFVVVWTAAAFGSERAEREPAPTFIYVTFWVGMIVADDRARERLVRARSLARDRRRGRLVRPAKLGYRGRRARTQQRLGVWPACALLFGFVRSSSCTRIQPTRGCSRSRSSLYSVATWTGMAIFGRDAWGRTATGSPCTSASSRGSRSSAAAGSGRPAGGHSPPSALGADARRQARRRRRVRRGDARLGRVRRASAARAWWHDRHLRHPCRDHESPSAPTVA